MLRWLRRAFGWFERRWIHDPEERHRHDELVRDRLALPGRTPPADPEPTGDE